MTQKKKILISLPYGMSARNVLRSKVYEGVLENYQVVLLTPLCGDPNFIQEFSREGVEILDLPKQMSLFFKGYRYLLDILEGVHFTRKNNIKTLQILASALKQQKPILFWSRLLFAKVVLAIPGLFERLRCYQDVLIGTRYFDQVLEEHRPDIVWQTHLIALEEFPLAFAAKKKKIPLLGMIHSWDNITAKSGIRSVVSNRPGRMIPIRYDHMIVWNYIQKEELIRYYQYRESDISVVGVPQFDFYVQHTFSSREEFCKRNGLNPAKKSILFACGSPFLLPKQEEVLEMLVSAMKNGKFQNVQLILRAHPATPMEFINRLVRNNPHAFAQFPSPAYGASRFQNGWQSGEEDGTELAETLRHCDVLINVASTLSLDAAMLDKPTICVGFDGKENNPYYFSLLKHYDLTHYQPVMKSGAVRLAKSPEELQDLIYFYLENPHADSIERKLLAMEMNPYQDGRSDLRILKALCERIS